MAWSHLQQLQNQFALVPLTNCNRIGLESTLLKVDDAIILSVYTKDFQIRRNMKAEV